MSTGRSRRRRVAAARLRHMDCVGEVSPSARVQAPIMLWLLGLSVIRVWLLDLFIWGGGIGTVLTSTAALGAASAPTLRRAATWR